MPRSPKKREDKPAWKGQRPWFEIWFAVLLDETRRRALWVRQTLFVPRTGDGRSTVWGAWFDASAHGPSKTPTVAAKRYFPLEDAKLGDNDRLIELAGSYI